MVGPIVVFATVVLLLIVARFYEKMPIQIPPCGFKELTGVPCLACRGTRSFQSITQGRLVEAIRLNPAAVFGVGVSIIWLSLNLARKGALPKNPMRASVLGWLVGGILVLNWIYLIATSDWYP